MNSQQIPTTTLYNGNGVTYKGYVGDSIKIVATVKNNLDYKVVLFNMTDHRKQVMQTLAEGHGGYLSHNMEEFVRNEAVYRNGFVMNGPPVGDLVARLSADDHSVYVGRVDRCIRVVAERYEDLSYRVYLTDSRKMTLFGALSKQIILQGKGGYLAHDLKDFVAKEAAHQKRLQSLSATQEKEEPA